MTQIDNSVEIGDDGAGGSDPNLGDKVDTYTTLPCPTGSAAALGGQNMPLLVLAEGAIL